MELMLIPALTFLAVTLVGGAILMGRRLTQAPVRVRLHQIEQEFEAPRPAVAPRRLVEVLVRIGQIVSSGRISSSLRDELSRAGYYGPAAPMMYLGIKILLGITGLTMAAVLLLPTSLPGSTRMLLTMTASFVLFMAPNLVVAARHSSRRTRVRNHLPDVVDLLEVCVSAGMGMDMAWNVVGDEIRHVCPVLADEMALVNLEIHLGAPRVEAMRHLSDRTGVGEIGSLVAILVQSERFGTSMAEALRIFATTMRETRSARAEETAEKMGVRMLIPMVLFIFPAIFVVLVGPAAVKALQVLGVAK